MDTKTISKLYSYKPIKSYIGLHGPLYIKNKDVFVGVEIEAEEVSTKKGQITTVKQIEDGSLKVAGKEFVTVPIKTQYLEIELKRLFSSFQHHTFSKRCSVHVHVNVRDLTMEELKKMVMIYMMFEKALYKFSGDRWNNNFCVPLFQTPALVQKFLREVDYFNMYWFKYTGLNISPVWGGESTKIGTVEYRQLEGTSDVSRIITWVNLITAIKRAAQNIEYEELVGHIRIMNTTSAYAWFTREVFGRFAKGLVAQETFIKDFESCVSNLKFCLPQPKKELSPIKVNKKSISKFEYLDLDIGSSTPVTTFVGATGLTYF